MVKIWARSETLAGIVVTQVRFLQTSSLNRSKKIISGFDYEHPPMKYEPIRCDSSVYCRHFLVSDEVNYSSKL